MRLFDAFGCDRCLWGTDWMRAVKFLTYKEAGEAFRITDWGGHFKLMCATPSS